MYYHVSEIESLALTHNQDYEPAFKVVLKPGATPCTPVGPRRAEVVLVSGVYGYLYDDEATRQDYRDFIRDFQRR